jgi:serine/threonine protein kinase/Tfp pilus assembly protein PilF
MDRPVPARRAEVVDAYVQAFEAARARDGRADPAGFLPPPDHPLYPDLVRELVRIDIEFGWSEGHPRPVDEYRGRFPAVFGDPDALREIAFEEYRQRLERGESVDPAEYPRRYGVDPGEWPAPAASGPPGTTRVPPPVALGGDGRCPGGAEEAGTAVVDGDPALLSALESYQRFLTGPRAGPKSSAPTALVGGVEDDALHLLREVHRADSGSPRRPAEGTTAFPATGDRFLGFHLVEELGRGAFGRVFLARQTDLANRPVALKVALELHEETQTLGQLQHTNIVPVYSVHRHGGLQAICMPYFGATTLGDVLQGLRAGGPFPESGKQLVSTLNDRKNRTRSESSSKPASDGGGTAPAAEPPAGRPEPTPRPGPAGSLARLEALSYVEAVLWLVARLADGLEHAHDRGIVHRDLKPANILLTDDGEPMILDFNLSADSKVRTDPRVARIGGTLPYMSPEQLLSFLRRAGTVDGRSDVYSLGVIAFELLTGQFPFPQRTGAVRRCVAEMRVDRCRPAPRLRPVNPAVSPAVESIVRRCLDPDAARRYQSARELREDLERQLAHQPLRHAPEPSLRERARKWARRHPRLTSSTTVAAAAAVVLLGVSAGAGVVWRQHEARLEAAEQEQARFAALDSWGRLRQARQVQLALSSYPDRPTVRHVMDFSREALREYAVLEDPAWEDRAPVSRLPAGEREPLRRTVADILTTWADAEREWAESDPDAEARREHLALAWALNERAEAVLGQEAGSRAVWQQRARLAELLGRGNAAELAGRAADTPPRTANDHFQLARELLRKKEVRKAVPHLAEATRLDTRHYWAWYFLGNCHYELLQFPEAVASYSACVGLAPDPGVAYFPYFHRGVVYSLQGRSAEAEGDFDRAAAALDSLPETLRRKERAKPQVEKARLKSRQKDYAAAEDVLTKALQSGATDPRLCYELGKVRWLRGDREGARRGLEEGLRHQPDDETDWNDRGLARVSADPAAALADFDEALKLNPVFHAALQNKANVLSERLGKEPEALEVLDRLVSLYPGFVPARIGRAVILARQGRRAEAHADLRESLARDRSPQTLYQAANVYALTSRQVPEDADRVVPLLAAALWGGFGSDVVDRDTDMDPVRNRPDFKRVVRIVRELRGD